MLALMAEREQSFPTAGRLPAAFRGFHAAKIRKIIQKTTFGEDINTISVQNTVQFVKRSVILRFLLS